MTQTIPVASEPSQSFSPNIRVWLVDDNDELRSMVAELLEQHDGIHCVRHFSSPDALLSALASKAGPDVILLDVQMGDRNGLDAVRPIKTLTRSTRVMMFTTCFNQDWRERAFNEGASDYLLKSDAVEKVAARIRSPAQDPVKNPYPRRRPKCSVMQSAQKPPPASTSGKVPGFLTRTLKMFGWHN